MINFDEIEKYRENNRIEAKKALGGFPNSLWETYSAFANTMGGVILLGVEEYRDHTLHPVNLPDPDGIIKEFRETINNKRRVSTNILSDKNVIKHRIGENTIIIIEVPRAQRADKPIYIDNNPYSGSYRRSGDGDYHCTEDEVKSMLRDASVKTQDMKVIESTSLDALCTESINSFRERVKSCRSEYAPENMSNNEFLIKIGAAANGADKALRPTAAGLLMFGYKSEIIKEFPNFSLEYNDFSEEKNSFSGDNVYGFYFDVCDKLEQSAKGRFKDAEAISEVLREALANAVINADYYGRGGIVVSERENAFEISNPGSFRINIDDAEDGGTSDPRNAAVIKMFNLADVGEGIGGGIPEIYMVWKRQGFCRPIIKETFNPDRIIMTLETKKAAGRSAPISRADKADIIIEYLTENPSASVWEIAREIGSPKRYTRRLLEKLIARGVVETTGKLYMLKR